MSKYIIDIPNKHEKDWVSISPLLGNELYVPLISIDKKYHMPTGIKLTPYNETLERIAIEAEVWEFAKTVSIMKPEDKRECWGTDKYNTINLGYSYQEAKAKYEAWKKQKEEIRVGDEVVYADDPNKEKAIVLRLYQPKQYRTLADIPDNFDYSDNVDGYRFTDSEFC